MATADATGLLGSLYVQLTADSTELVRAVNSAKSTVEQGAKHIENSLGHITEGFKHLVEILAVAEVVHFVQETLEAVDAIGKLSQELGIGVQTLAEFKFAADKANVGENFALGMRQFALAMREARTEGTDMQLLFRKIGLDAFQPMDQAFLQSSDIISRWKDGVDKVGVVQELFGTRNARMVALLNEGSKGLRDQQSLFRQLAGTDIADAARTASEFEDVLKDLKEATKGLALVLAKEAVPALTEFLKQMTLHISSLKEGASIIGQIGKGAVFLASTIYEGLLGTFKAISIAILTLGKFWVDTFRTSLDMTTELINFTTNAVVSSINIAIQAINTLMAHMPKINTALLGVLSPAAAVIDKFSGGKLSSSLNTGVANFEPIQPIEFKLNLQPPLHDQLKGMSEIAGIAIEDFKNSLVHQFFDVKTEVTKEGNDVAKAINDSVAPNVEQLKLLREKLKLFDEEHTKEYAQEFANVVKDRMRARGIDNEGSKIFELEADKELNKLRIKELKKFGEDQTLLTKEMEERRVELLKQYQDRQKALILAQRGTMISSFKSMNDSVLGVIEQFAGKQSGIYKAMFAASKAFAIAESTVKIMQGIAEASSLPWPLNLGAIASVVAATASIITTIASTTLELAGGTPTAKASGGPVDSNRMFLVGERGPELFVPSTNGQIIPNDRLGGGTVRVVINNHTPVQPEVMERREGDERVIEVIMRQLKNDMAGDVRDGRGPLTKALENTFALRRATR